MSIRNFGNGPLFSTTAATLSNPSTATLCAELILPPTPVPESYEVRWGIGASTGGIWLLEQCISSGLGSTAIVKQIAVFTGTNQTSEFVTTQRSTSIDSSIDRFRVRLLSTFTGTVGCWIQVEPIT